MSTQNAYLHVRTLGSADVASAAALLGRGMADNPLHLAVHGGDEADRARKHEQLMRVLLDRSPRMRAEGVELRGSLIGVAASSRSSDCQPSAILRGHLLRTALAWGPRSARRLVEWSSAWARHDPSEPHVHLGPVAVDRHARGRGIGTLLLLRHASSLDAVGAVGYLETDRREAVAFYRRFDYVVVHETDVLGVPCWFMRRPAR